VCRGDAALSNYLTTFSLLLCYVFSEDLRGDNVRERLIHRGRRSNGSTSVGCSYCFYSPEVWQCRDGMHIVHASCILYKYWMISGADMQAHVRSVI